jgi:hypothetical protein
MIAAAARSPILPAPLDFALDALEAEGALCERGEREGEAMVMLPAALARRLDVPEECRLALYPEHKGDVGVNLGSPLLERLVAEARARAPAASVRLEIEPPRLGHVRSAAERFVLRNGLSEVLTVSFGSAVYAVASVAYVIEADDRREGLTRLTVHATDGGEPDAATGGHLDLLWPEAVVRPSPTPLSAPGAAPWIALRAERAVREAAAPVLADVRRRHARDHARITSYFADLVAEARAPRRRADAKVVEAKAAHLLADRDAKLRDLGGRFAVKITCAVAAAVVAEVPAALVSVRLRRRKEAREIVLRVPAGAQSVDRICCEGCGGTTGKPAACDERMHLLCEGCAPAAQGRIACPACGRKR